MKTKLIQLFRPVPLPTAPSISLLIMRLIMGSAFVIHGWGKIKQPFSWMGEEATVPGFFQLLAAISEFGGGIALIIGLLTPLAMLGLGFTMLVAAYTHKFVLKDPFVAGGPGEGSYEPALVYLGLSIVFLVIGAGKFSLDALVFGERHSTIAHRDG